MSNSAPTYNQTVIGPTLGTGVQTIGLYLAEDSYAGDVQITISVNGVQIGGIQTVSALQSSNTAELFTINGDWSGTPTISVDFLNDDWDGRTGQGHDRNLYVDNVTYNGVATPFNPRTILWSGPAYISTRPIMRASDFLNTIGVTTHMLYADTSYNNEALVLASLAYLGIDHVRDGGDVRDPSVLTRYEALMAQGVSLDFTSLPAVGVSTEIDRIKTLLAAYPGQIASIEGVNEATADFSYGGQTGQAAALQFQRDLYAAVKADPALNSINVLNYTLLSQDPADYTRYGVVSSSADLGNVHMYPSGGLTNLASTLLPRELENTSGSSGFVITETGYDTISNTEEQQADYVIDTLLDATQAGASATYIYELLDENPDPNRTNSENNYGLFHADGTPKRAAVALHILSGLMADTAASSSWTPQPLAYTIENLPSIGQSLALAKSDGSYNIALWAETPLGTVTPTTVVTLHLSAVAPVVEIYDLITGPDPVSTYDNAADITIALGADPLIVQVAPPAASPPITVPQPAVSPLPAPAPAPAPIEPTATESPTTSPDVDTAPQTAAISAVTVYRFFDTLNGTQFLTASAEEREQILDTRSDLVDEGIGLHAAASIPDQVAVLRFFDTVNGTHFYTTSPAESADILATRPDLVQEGVAFYEQAKSLDGFDPVYRFFNTNNGTHFYTSSAQEASLLTSRPDLLPEGIAFYTPS